MYHQTNTQIQMSGTDTMKKSFFSCALNHGGIDAVGTKSRQNGVVRKQVRPGAVCIEIAF